MAKDTRPRTAKDQLAQYAPYAQALQASGSVPASVTLAQMLLESDKGNSNLAINHNNLFGVTKGSTWTGDTYVSGKYTYRSYDNQVQSILDHAAVLKQDRYINAGVYKSQDPYTVASAIKAAGYAEDANYASKLMDVINSYNLTQYDVKVTGDKLPTTVKELQEAAGQPTTPSLGDVFKGAADIFNKKDFFIENAPEIMEDAYTDAIRPKLIKISTWASVAVLGIGILLILIITLLKSSPGKAAVSMLPAGRVANVAKIAGK